MCSRSPSTHAPQGPSTSPPPRSLGHSSANFCLNLQTTLRIMWSYTGRASASVSLFLIFSPFPLPFLFFFPLPPFHHFPSEALPSGRGRAGLTPRLSPAPAALWREGAPSSPGHQRQRSEERDRRRRPPAQGHHGISSLSDPSAAAVRPARVPAPAGPVCPLLPPQSARP